MIDGSGGTEAESPGPSRGGRSRLDPERVTEVVLAVPDLVSMSAGPLGQFRSYRPGGDTVVGVRVDADQLDVNVIARYGPNLALLGDRVRQALEPIAAGRSVSVGIDDVVIPGDSTTGDSTTGAAARDAADSMTEPERDPALGSGLASVPPELEH